MRPKRVIVSAVGALVGAAAIAGAAFAVQLLLPEPPRATLVASTIVTNVRRERLVWSRAELNGRRLDAVCRTVGTERFSWIEFGDGRSGLVAWKRLRAFGKRWRELGSLSHEILLAGCAGQLDRLLARQIRLAVDAGKPVRLTPALLRGRPAYRIRLWPKPRLVYLFVDRERLVPIGIFLRTPTVSGASVLDVAQTTHVRRRGHGLH
jgi:hypothetical protein